MIDPGSKTAAVICALIAGGCIGYALTPVKIETKTVTVEVEKKTTDEDTSRNKHQETTTVEVKKPDGTIEKTTKTTTDTETKKEEHTVDTTEKQSDTTTTKYIGNNGFTASVLAGGDLSALSSGWIFGGEVSRPVLGPVRVGAWGLSNKTAGVSLGLTF